MTIRCRFLLTAVFASGIAALPACYTIADHPRLARLNYARPDDNRCANCHSDEEIWAFNNPTGQPTHKSFSRAWMRYYDTAWWYGKRWDYHPNPDNVNSPIERTNDHEE
jgi:hypothetical protein